MAVWAVLGDRPVAYHPALARALGNDVNAALFLGQIMYWSNKGTWRPGWVAKTQKEIYHETALTRSQQERVRRKLIKLGILSERLQDVPARLYFRVHWARLTKILMGQLENESSPDCGKQAIKDAKKPQTKAAKPATQVAEKSQSIPEISAENTHQTTQEKSGGEPPPSVLDEVFPDSAKARSDSTVINGDLDELTTDEKAQIATPGAGQSRPNMDQIQAAWYITSKNIHFPFGLSWVDVYYYANNFGELFAIPIPSSKTTISQWRRGIVDIFIAFADELAQAGFKRDRQQILRRSNWAMQVLHARRLAGDDYAFDIVSPMSIANTLRVMSGQLRAMQNQQGLAPEDLPEAWMIDDYFASLAHKRKRRSGSDVTGDTIMELEAATRAGVMV